MRYSDINHMVLVGERREDIFCRESVKQSKGRGRYRQEIARLLVNQW